jgi:predicted house-cleaning noncanonical NTP pyrophosphatase (MazG superfamily)
MEKSEFINILMTKTPEEINRYIEDKGKKGKPFCPVVFHDSSKYKNLEDKDYGKM